MPSSKFLDQNEIVYKTLFETIDFFTIFFLNVEGNIQTWGAGGTKTLGYNKDEILGKHFSTLFPDKTFLKKFLEKKLIHATEIDLLKDKTSCVRKDGSFFQAKVCIYMVFDQNDKHIGYTVIIDENY